MIEFALAFVVFVAAVAALCLGVLFGRAGVQGSCGGLGDLPGIRADCGGTCGRPCKRRKMETPGEAGAVNGEGP
jgi:hypothetical protein